MQNVNAAHRLLVLCLITGLGLLTTIAALALESGAADASTSDIVRSAQVASQYTTPTATRTPKPATANRREALQDDDLPPPPPRPTVRPPTATPQRPTADPPRSHETRSSRPRHIDLAVQQGASQHNVKPGDMVTFVITTTHQSGVRYAENVLIYEELPTFLDLEYAETSWGTLSTTNKQVRVTIPVLLPDDMVVVRIVARVNNQPAPDFMQIIASVDSDTEDRNETNDRAAVPLFGR
ncbi:MAG: hypothetical protein HC876_15605 [Chloroflexaceae bacterium]|nr:hypothetical protein [Chloroflexaceae bacterium]